MWGDDQYENFKEDVVPPYCIAAYDRFKFTTPPGNVWDETDQVFDLPGHPKAAKMLASELIEAGFDTAYAYKPLHHPLGHAFTNAILYLDYERQGFDYPFVPFAINCYGRKVLAQRGGLPVFDRAIAESDFDPPAPSPRRLFDPWRGDGAHPRPVALSRGADRLVGLEPRLPDRQEQLSLARHAGRPANVRGTEAGDWQAWRALSGRSVEDSGQQEILNWSCLAGAMSALELKPQETGFARYLDLQFVQGLPDRASPDLISRANGRYQSET